MNSELPTPPEGMRLLEPDEKGAHFTIPVAALLFWNINQWDAGGVYRTWRGNSTEGHYATALSPAELRAARGIPEQPVSDTPRSDARAMQYSWAGDDADFARTLERELSAAQRENAELRQNYESELRRWQDAIREKCQKLTPAGHIDGSGCDSGDPLDLTLAEIEQGIGWHIDNNESILARAEAADATNEKLRDALEKIRSISASDMGSTAFMLWAGSKASEALGKDIS